MGAGLPRRGPQPPLVGSGATVDEEELTGYEASLRRREVDDRPGHVLRRAEALQRGAGNLHIAKTWVLAHTLAGQVGFDEARAHRIDRDPAGRELQSQGFRQSDNAALSGAVRDALHATEDSVDRRDVDHATAVTEDRTGALRHERDALPTRLHPGLPRSAGA